MVAAAARATVVAWAAWAAVMEAAVMVAAAVQTAAAQVARDTGWALCK